MKGERSLEPEGEKMKGEVKGKENGKKERKKKESNIQYSYLSNMGTMKWYQFWRLIDIVNYGWQDHNRCLC